MSPRISSPMSWTQVRAYAAKRQLMPSSLRTATIQRDLPAQIRRMAQFSSQVSNAESLQLLDQVARRIADPSLAGDRPGAYMDVEKGVEILQAYLRDIGYTPAPGTKGGLSDFSSASRLRVALKTPAEMMRGIGQYLQSNDPAVLDAFPAQELVRIKNFSAIARGTARNWPARWRAAGGHFYGSGRMVALKGDPIWTTISAFGNPYPPFDYNSGMGLRDLSRKEAVALGIIAPSAPPPTVAPLPGVQDDFYDLSRFSADLAAAVARAFDGNAELVNGVLQWRT